MGLLTQSFSATAGTDALASDYNTNRSELLTWANGGIGVDNLDLPLTSTLSWSITSGLEAIDVANSGSEGSVKLTQSVALAATKSGLELTHSAAETNGQAGLYINFSNAGSTIPAIKVDYGGDTNFEVNADGVALPSRTTAERDSSSPAEGAVLYNTTTKTFNYYDGNNWVNMGTPSGTVVDFAGGSVPDGWLACDGAEYAQVTYPQLYAAIGDIYATTNGQSAPASGNFRVPGAEGRVSVGAGSGPSLTSRTLGDEDGAETHQLTDAEMPSHNHSGTTAGSTANFTGIINTEATQGQVTVDESSGGASPGDHFMQSTTNNGTAGTGSHYHTITTASLNGAQSGHTHTFTTSVSGSDTAHNNMQPFIAFNKIIKI